MPIFYRDLYLKFLAQSLANRGQTRCIHVGDEAGRLRVHFYSCQSLESPCEPLDLRFFISQRMNPTFPQQLPSAPSCASSMLLWFRTFPPYSGTLKSNLWWGWQQLPIQGKNFSMFANHGKETRSRGKWYESEWESNMKNSNKEIGHYWNGVNNPTRNFLCSTGTRQWEINTWIYLIKNKPKLQSQHPWT